MEEKSINQIIILCKNFLYYKKIKQDLFVLINKKIKNIIKKVYGFQLCLLCFYYIYITMNIKVV